MTTIHGYPTRLLVGVALVSLLGCGSSSHAAPTIDAGPPVADPGGPFVADLPPDRAIANLNLAETDTLCRALANAYDGFLSGAIQVETTCRQLAGEVAHDVVFFDAGTDPAAACVQEYTTCIGDPMKWAPFRCPFLISIPNAPPCDATVEDVSACLNEIAALDPVGTCVTTAGCDGGGTATQDAASPATQDAAPTLPPVDAGPTPAMPDAAPARPTPPACVRLYQLCPLFTGWASFPC
jgi:hypothetical protein